MAIVVVGFASSSSSSDVWVPLTRVWARVLTTVTGDVSLLLSVDEMVVDRGRSKVEMLVEAMSSPGTIGLLADVVVDVVEMCSVTWLMGWKYIERHCRYVYYALQ